MARTDNDPIWYAAYGSNCRRARFEAYLTGDRAVGATRTETGARDSRPPCHNKPFWFPRQVRFAGNSRKWGGGGVAFLDHEPGGPSPGRRYLITRGQFDDVVAQESRRAVAPIPVDQLEVGVVTPLGDGAYDGLIAFEPIEGVAVVSFTSPRPPVSRATNPPSAAYLGTILQGLLEVHDEPVDALVAAIMRAPGISDGWTAENVADLIMK